MFAWTSVQAIFATPGVELFSGNKRYRYFGETCGKVQDEATSKIFDPNIDLPKKF